MMQKLIIQKNKILLALTFIASSLIHSTLIHAQAPQSLTFSEKSKQQKINRSLQIVLRQAQLAASSLGAQSIIQNQVLTQLHALQKKEQTLKTSNDQKSLTLITHQKRVLQNSFLEKILPQLEPLQEQTRQYQLRTQEEIKRCESENPGCRNLILSQLKEKKPLLAALVPSSITLSPELKQFKEATFLFNCNPALP